MDVSDANDYEGFIEAFQEGADMTVSSDLECMTSHLDLNHVNNHLKNAYRYGSNNAIF
jgi:hypothetical protein